MFFALIISLRFKISLHSIGMAAATGYIYMLIPYAKFNLMPVFIVSLILTGIVGSARLVLSSHSPIQVYMGFLLGWNVSIFTFLLLY
jgi:membrane-associated phospholipid phosphatase